MAISAVCSTGAANVDRMHDEDEWPYSIPKKVLFLVSFSGLTLHPYE